jgi:hypothetical protein
MVYDISPTALVTLERAIGGLTGPTGSTGPTGPPGPPASQAGGITGSIQFNQGNTLGTLLGSSRFLFDGVQTTTINGQTIQGISVGPGTGLFFNNNLTISPTRVYTSRNTVDDGTGNASIQGNLIVGSLTGTTIQATNTILTPSLTVNGVNLVKPIYCLAGVNNSGTGNLNFGSILFSTGGTFVAGGQTLTLPTLSITASYLVSLAGTGLTPVTLNPATLIINAPLASVTTLYQGSVNNASSIAQSLTTESESVLIVSANVSCVVSASTTVFTSFTGRLSVTQLI